MKRLHYLIFFCLSQILLSPTVLYCLRTLTSQSATPLLPQWQMKISWFPLICISVRQNPTWRSLDFGMLPDLLDTSASCFVVRIWGGQEEEYTLLIEWKVNLDGLRYTGQQVSSLSYFQIWTCFLTWAQTIINYRLYVLLPNLIHRFDPGIQMRSYLD